MQMMDGDGEPRARMLRQGSVSRDSAVIADEKQLEKEHREERAILANLVENQQ